MRVLYLIAAPAEAFFYAIWGDFTIRHAFLAQDSSSNQQSFLHFLFELIPGLGL